MKSSDASKELYKRLRAVPWARLWTEEVPKFDQAAPRERFERVSIIRAVGVVFSESGPANQREEVTQWLLRLLHDSEEKLRRYAMTALAKVGAGPAEETELLTLFRTTTSMREKEFLARTFGKIGSTAALDAIEATSGVPSQAVQQVKARAARDQSGTTIRLDAPVPEFARMRIHLRGRRGLEGIVRQEIEAHGQFRVATVCPGLVAIETPRPFTLRELLALRCFGTMGFVLGRVKGTGEVERIKGLAAAITSPFAQRLLETLSDGPIRYRLECVGAGHQRATVRRVADLAFELCPRILNDTREAPWTVDIHRQGEEETVELRPRWSPDPRFAYRLGDVPAASHPPLAASMARLAGWAKEERVWDPFCGSGLELIERVRLGGVRRVFGTDRSGGAIGIAQRNFAAAQLSEVEARFTCCDFRDFTKIAGLGPKSLSLIITNPPFGRRVPISNLRGLFDDLFAIAAHLLEPGGRLVLTNPLDTKGAQRSLRLESRLIVDLGGFDCHLELHRRS